MGTGEDSKARFREDISSLDHMTLTSKLKKLKPRFTGYQHEDAYVQ